MLAGCAEKVQALEAEVEALRQQLLEQGQHGAISCTPAAESADEPGPDESRGLAMQHECDAPFAITPAGIKRFKEHCVHALQLGSCDVPYVLDSRGVKSFKRACVQSR